MYPPRNQLAEQASLYQLLKDASSEWTNYEKCHCFQGDPNWPHGRLWELRLDWISTLTPLARQPGDGIPEELADQRELRITWGLGTFFFFLPHHMACGILVPWPAAVEAWSLNHWTDREVPYIHIFKNYFLEILQGNFVQNECASHAWRHLHFPSCLKC